MAEGKSSGLDAPNLHVEPIDNRRLAVRQNHDSLTDAVELNNPAKNIDDGGRLFGGELPFDEVWIRLAINDDVLVQLVLFQRFDESTELRRGEGAAITSEFLGTGVGFCSHSVFLFEVVLLTI